LDGYDRIGYAPSRDFQWSKGLPPPKINADKPHLWKTDIAASVDAFNQWFMTFAPQAFRSTRVKTTQRVKAALLAMDDLRKLNAETLKANPSALSTLRMCTAPPLAVDRLIGLASANKSLIGSMEEGKLAVRMKPELLAEHLGAVCRVLMKLLDRDIFPWLDAGKAPTEHERDRASTIVADRLCSAVAKDIVRRALRKHQSSVVAVFLDSLGFREAQKLNNPEYSVNEPGTYAFDVCVPLAMGDVSMLPVDIHVIPIDRRFNGKHVLLDLGSSQDVREAALAIGRAVKKRRALDMTYGDSARYALVLGGAYDAGNLGTLAAEGVDWVWQHRIQTMLHMLG
jgi:hypothetical protein